MRAQLIFRLGVPRGFLILVRVYWFDLRLSTIFCHCMHTKTQEMAWPNDRHAKHKLVPVIVCQYTDGGIRKSVALLLARRGRCHCSGRRRPSDHVEKWWRQSVSLLYSRQRKFGEGGRSKTYLYCAMVEEKGKLDTHGTRRNAWNTMARCSRKAVLT